MLKSTIKSFNKVGSKVVKGASKVARKTSVLAKRSIGRKGRQALKGVGDKLSKIKGKMPFVGDLKLPDNADSPIKSQSIASMVKGELANQREKTQQKLQEGIEGYDPNNFLSKIFDGGLSKLEGFGNSIEKMANSGQLEFLEKANELATKFVDKLASGKGGGGFLRAVGNILKIGAGIGLAALAAPFVGPVIGAVATVGAITGGLVLAGKGIYDFVTGKGLFKNRKKEKEKKKKEKENEAFAKIAEDFGACLAFLEKPIADTTKESETKTKQKGDSDFESQETLMGISDVSAEISTTPDGKLIIERTSSSSENKTITRTKEDYKQLLEKKKKQYKEYEESGDNKKMAGAQRFIRYYEKVIALMEEKGLEELKVNVKSYKKSGRDGRDGGRGFRGTRGLPGSNLESSAMNIYENARDFALAPPPVKFMQIINAAKDFIFGKPSEATSLETPIGKEEQKAEELKPSTVETDTTEKDLRLEASSEISTSPNAGGGGGGGGETPQVIDMQKDVDAQNAVAGDGPKVPTMSKSGNKIPILFAIDNRNIHLPFTRSVFNIVDAK